MGQALNVTIHMTGLIAYARRPKNIEALFPAESLHCHGDETAGDGAGDHHQHDQQHAGGDVHRAALVLPLAAVDKGSAAPDEVLNSGPEELGVWRLEGSVLEVWRDGRPPAPALHYVRSADLPHPPSPQNQDDLFWIPEIQRAIALPSAQFKSGCFPPLADPRLVSAVVRLMEGSAAALWSSDAHQHEIWQFTSPVHGSRVRSPEYRQAFADGVRWSFDCSEFVEIRLSSLSGGSLRSIYVPILDPDATAVHGAITNKPSTVGGRSVLESDAQPGHFAAFYDLMQPAAGRLSRRLLVRAGAPTSTTTNRCPGGSGG